MLVLIRPEEPLAPNELQRLQLGLTRLADQMSDIANTIRCSPGGITIELPDDGSGDHRAIGRVVALLIGALIGRMFDYTLTCECCPVPIAWTDVGMAAFSAGF